jgi:Flp pilus assembly pilin Flp
MFPRKFERGQGMAEYGLSIILVAIVVIVVLQILGVSIGEMYTFIVGQLPFA